MNRKTCLVWAALACALPQFAQTPAEGLTPDPQPIPFGEVGEIWVFRKTGG